MSSAAAPTAPRPLPPTPPTSKDKSDGFQVRRQGHHSPDRQPDPPQEGSARHPGRPGPQPPRPRLDARGHSLGARDDRQGRPHGGNRRRLGLRRSNTLTSAESGPSPWRQISKERRL